MQRCRAKSKRSAEQCKNYAVKGWAVCRMHGARGGPKTSSGYLACKKASMQHGMYCREALAEHILFKSILKGSKLPGSEFSKKIRTFQGVDASIPVRLLSQVE
jgi:hypothetical protein